MTARPPLRAALAAALLLLAAAAPPPSAYESGVAARQAGDVQRAVEFLTEAVRREPENADAHLQLGYALLAARRLDAAEAEFDRTLVLAPDYADARQGLALVAERRGAPAAAAAPRLEADIEASYSALDRGRPDWREGAIELRYRSDDSTTFAARVEQSRRFGLDDTFLELRYQRRFVNAGRFSVGAGAAPGADFRPRWQVGAGGSLGVRGGSSATVLTLDARQARFRTGDVQTLNPGIEQYVAGGRAWLTGRMINVFDEGGSHRLGWLARGDVQASRRLRLYAGYADAPDTSEGRVVDTESLFGGVAIDASERTTVRFSAARERRADSSTRVQLGVGLGLRF